MSTEKLPEGWVGHQLDEIATDINYGYTASSTSENIGPKMLRITDIQDNKVDWNSVPFCKIEDNQKDKYLLCNGDLVFARTGATVGKSFLINEDISNTVFASYLIRVRCNKKISSHYLSYFFRSPAYWNQIMEFSAGIGQPNVNGSKLKKLNLPLASVYEQKIIAEKLDTLLAQVDSTKARLEQIPQVLKRFRQAVLASALKGKLTSKWRIDNKNLQDISSFKTSITKYRFENWVKEQEEKFKNKGKQPKNDIWKKKYKEAVISQDISDKDIPDGWLFEPLDGLVYISARIGWKGLKASEYTAKGPLFLSVHSLNYGKEVNLSQAYHISEHRYDESPEIKLQNDDVLLCKDGAGIGKLAIVKNLNEPATINSSLLLIRAGDFFIPEYLFYFLSGPDMQNLVKERMTGSAVPHLFQRDVKEFVLEVPPLNEQQEIVRRVEQLFDYADTIEKQVNNALTRVNNLTQSILAKAFRGELTAQWRAENPDLISGENSAAALLEKIKAERAASNSKKVSRKKA